MRVLPPQPVSSFWLLITYPASSSPLSLLKPRIIAAASLPLHSDSCTLYCNSGSSPRETSTCQHFHSISVTKHNSSKMDQLTINKYFSMPTHFLLHFTSNGFRSSPLCSISFLLYFHSFSLCYLFHLSMRYCHITLKCPQ